MKQFDHGYALLIGVNDCEVKKWALPTVAKDITALNNVLIDPERCAYPKNNITALTGEGATKERIMEGLDWLKNKLNEDHSQNATAIIYYSGHGCHSTSPTSSEYYLIPYNVKEESFASSAVQAAEFSGAISAIQSRRLLVVLDCCHAGGMGVKDIDITLKDINFTQEDINITPLGYDICSIPPEQLMLGEKSIFKAGEEKIDTLENGNGRAVLSSSSGAQKSYIRKDGEMSIFTFHLIEALTGCACPINGAEEVLVTDVMGYVTRHVPTSARKEWSQEQTPSHRIVGNFPIALLGAKPLTPDDPFKKVLTAGINSLEIREYEAAVEYFKKAKGLEPDDERAQIFYGLSYLAGKPILSIRKDKMNEISTMLIKLTQRKNIEKENLVRILLGIIWFDYYLKVDHEFKTFFFRENVNYLRNYFPPNEEKDLLHHIIYSGGAEALFRLK